MHRKIELNIQIKNCKINSIHFYTKLKLKPKIKICNKRKPQEVKIIVENQNQFFSKTIRIVFSIGYLNYPNSKWKDQ